MRDPFVRAVFVALIVISPLAVELAVRRSAGLGTGPAGVPSSAGSLAGTELVLVGGLIVASRLRGRLLAWQDRGASAAVQTGHAALRPAPTRLPAGIWETEPKAARALRRRGGGALVGSRTA